MFSATVPLLLLSPGLALQGADASTFAAPVQLTAGGEPMGHAQMFPSPALFDLDRDGMPEMIVGDLFGNLMVSRRAPADDRAEWSAPEPLQGADGKALKFHNW